MCWDRSKRKSLLCNKEGHIRNKWQKAQNFQSQYWAKIALHPDEVFQSPQGIIEELKKGKEELAEECKKLRIEVEGEETLIIPKGSTKLIFPFLIRHYE